MNLALLCPKWSRRGEHRNDLNNFFKKLTPSCPKKCFLSTFTILIVTIFFPSLCMHCNQNNRNAFAQKTLNFFFLFSACREWVSSVMSLMGCYSIFLFVFYYPLYSNEKNLNVAAFVGKFVNYCTCHLSRMHLILY